MQCICFQADHQAVGTYSQSPEDNGFLLFIQAAFILNKKYKANLWLKGRAQWQLGDLKDAA